MPLGTDSSRPVIYSDLPVGTILLNRGTGSRIRVDSLCGHPTFFAVSHIRKDGGRDRRWSGWSGSLRKDTWELEDKS